MAATLEERISELTDYLATIPDEKVDPRAWRTLLVYVPAWLVKERAKKDERRVEPAS